MSLYVSIVASGREGAWQDNSRRGQNEVKEKHKTRIEREKKKRKALQREGDEELKESLL